MGALGEAGIVFLKIWMQYTTKPKNSPVHSEEPSKQFKPIFKSKSEVVEDPLFLSRLEAKMTDWERVREAGVAPVPWQ